MAGELREWVSRDLNESLLFLFSELVVQHELDRLSDSALINADDRRTKQQLGSTADTRSDAPPAAATTHHSTTTTTV